MFLNFFTARRAAANEIDTIDFSRDEALHPVIADLISSQEKMGLLSPFERDYGSKRRIDCMPVAFV